jgi:hypothetical protein
VVATGDTLPTEEGSGVRHEPPYGVVNGVPEDMTGVELSSRAKSRDLLSRLGDRPTSE